MEVNQFDKVSSSITYWSDKELEKEIDSTLPDILLGLDNESTQLYALRVIEKIKNRFSGNSYIRPPVILLSKYLTKNYSITIRNVSKVLLEAFLPTISKDDIMEFVNSLLIGHNQKTTSISVDTLLYYIFFVLSSCEISSALLSQLTPTSQSSFIELFNQLLTYFAPWDDSSREQFHDYTIIPSHANLQCLFSHLPANQFLPLVTGILEQLSSLPNPITITSYSIGITATVPALSSLSKKRFQSILPVYSSVDSIPNTKEYEQIVIRLLQQCQGLVKEKQLPGVISWILESFSKMVLTQSLLEKFLWFLTSHDLFIQQRPSVYDLYLSFYSILIKQIPNHVQPLVIHRMWPLFFKRLFLITKQIKESKSQQDVKRYETTCSHILTILRVMVDCKVSVITFSPADLKCCFDWIIYEMDTHKTKLYMELYYLVSGLSHKTYDMKLYFDVLYAYAKEHNQPHIVTRCILEWLHTFDLSRVDVYTLFCLLLDGDETSKAGTIPVDLLPEFRRFVACIPWKDVHLEDIVLQTSSPTSPVKDLGLNGRGNFLAFLCCCFIEQSKYNQQLFSNNRVCGGVNYAISSYLKCDNTQTLQIVIDEDSWKKETSTSAVVESSMIPYHYLQLLLQIYDNQFHSSVPDPTEAGCLSSCLFQTTLSFIMGKLAQGEALPLGSLLHFFYYFIPKDTFIQYLGTIQDLCNPLSILGRPGVRNEASKQKRIIQYCNYVNCMSPDLPMSFRLLAVSTVHNLLDKLDNDQPQAIKQYIVSSISHYIFYMASILIDLSSAILDQIAAYQQVSLLELLPTIIKALQKTSVIHGNIPLPAAHRDTIYNEVDYVFDKISAYFDPIFDSIDFYVKDWKYQDYICSIFAEVQYHYFCNLHTFIKTIFSKYLTSTNRKYNRIGLLLLKSLLIYDLQELHLNESDIYQIRSPDQYSLGDAILYRGLHQHDGIKTICFDNCHCLLDAYLKDIQHACLLFYEHEDIIVQNCCCEIFTLLYDFVLHHPDNVTISPQILIDELAPTSFVAWTDCSEYLKNIQIHSNSANSIETIVRIAKEIKEPFLVYVYIQEELLYNLGNKPELREDSLYIDASHQMLEKMIRKQSSRIVIEQEYLAAMATRKYILFFYSHHPYEPLRTVCQRICKAIRKDTNELTFIQSLFPSLNTVLSRYLESPDLSLLLCSCNCITALLTSTGNASFRQLVVSKLPLLFERANEFLMFHNGAYSTILNCIQSISKSVIQWIQKTKQSEMVMQVLPLFIEKQQSSDDQMTQLCRTAVFGCLQSCSELPSSLVRTVADYLMSEVNFIANRSKTNYLSHHAERLGIDKNALSQQRFWEIEQNEVTHVWNWVSTIIQQSDYMDYMNTLLSFMEHAEWSVQKMLFHILEHFVASIDVTVLGERSITVITSILFSICEHQFMTTNECNEAISTFTFIIKQFCSKNETTIPTVFDYLYSRLYRAIQNEQSTSVPLLLLLDLLTHLPNLKTESPHILRFYPWILLQRERKGREARLCESILPMIVVSFRYYCTHFSEAFAQFVILCLQQGLPKAYLLHFINIIFRPIPEDLPLSWVQPFSSLLMMTVESLQPFLIGNEDMVNGVMKLLPIEPSRVLLWVLNELITDNVEYAQTVFKKVEEALSSLQDSSIFSWEFVQQLLQDLTAQLEEWVKKDGFALYLKGIMILMEKISYSQEQKQQTLSIFTHIQEMIQNTSHREEIDLIMNSIENKLVFFVCYIPYYFCSSLKRTLFFCSAGLSYIPFG